MKAYKDAQGRARLFRPDMNMRRLNSSAACAALPTFDIDAMLTLLAEYVRLESPWIPAYVHAPVDWVEPVDKTIHSLTRHI
jgi:branched-chain amino acid aminotransferase